MEVLSVCKRSGALARRDKKNSHPGGKKKSQDFPSPGIGSLDYVEGGKRAIGEGGASIREVLFSFRPALELMKSAFLERKEKSGRHDKDIERRA